MKKVYSTTLITALALYVGLITTIPLAILENLGYLGNYPLFDILSIKPIGLIGLFYMSVMSSILAYMIYQWSIKFVKVSDTAFFGYLAPIFTLPFSYLFLGEVPTFLMFVGAGIIGIGVYIAEKNLSK
jgi:drug/metabolite transporter (DMT)-like permease